MSISPNKFVACIYELYVGSENEREMMEATTKERPLEYIHGMGMMLPAFEQQLNGLKTGDKFDFVLSSEEAYGERIEEAVQELPKDIFVDENGQFDSAMVFEGNTIPMQTSDGQTLQGSVLEVREDVVVMDFNHPLAGETLHFIGEVIEVHEATTQEIERFFGNSGGCSCGCGCGSDCDCGCNSGGSCGCTPKEEKPQSGGCCSGGCSCGC